MLLNVVFVFMMVTEYFESTFTFSCKVVTHLKCAFRQVT